VRGLTLKVPKQKFFDEIAESILRCLALAYMPPPTRRQMRKGLTRVGEAAAKVKENIQSLESARNELERSRR
jgi:hypothetical protein